MLIVKKVLLTLVLSILWLISVHTYAQTVLVPGDIFITTINTNPDYIEFVSRVSITTGTVIYFSDNAWRWDNTRRTGEWNLVFTATNLIPTGTILWIHGADSAIPVNTYVSPTWFANISRVPLILGFDLSTAGDQILLYQWSAVADPSPSFIYWISIAINNWWITSWNPSVNNSYLPSTLHVWTSAFLFTPAVRKSIQYRCSNRNMSSSSFWTGLYSTSCWSWSNNTSFDGTIDRSIWL